MMGDVYRLANPVFAFLGLEELYSTYILKRLDFISSLINVDFGKGPLTPRCATKSHWVDLSHKIPLGKRELTALYHLIYRPWFGRLLIRQEIGLGGSSTALLCGPKGPKGIN